MATDGLYQNNAVLQYAIPGNPPPTIDARAFDNENWYGIGYYTYNPGISLFPAVEHVVLHQQRNDDGGQSQHHQWRDILYI